MNERRYASYQGPVQKKVIAKLRALMEDLPEEPNAGEPIVKHRWATIIALSASLAGFAWLIIAAVAGRIPST